MGKDKNIFTSSQRRGILFLLPLVAVVVLLASTARRPRGEESFRELVDVVERRPDTGVSRQADNGVAVVRGVNPPLPEPFAFDPNTVGLDGLVALGFSPRQAQGIINYRNAGKRFRTADEFSTCYTVSEEMFRRLEPYITIADKESAAEILSEDSLAAPQEKVMPVAAPVMVDLNRADSAELCSVRGIGPLTAQRIAAYRARLGGFADVSQLAEIEGMREANYQTIVKEIFIDSAVIQKIDINFASPKRLGEHPYIDGPMLRKLLKIRQLKGGWSNIEDMVDDEILTRREAGKLAPYLVFDRKFKTSSK